MKRKAPKSDPQQQQLYKFEDGFMRAAMLGSCTRSTLQSLADKACRRWRVPQVDVVFSQHNTLYGQQFGDENKIRLYDAKDKAGNGRNAHVLLHEVAHHIDDHKSDGIESHGPVFAAICMDLYDHYNLLPRAAFRLLAKTFRVKIARGVHHKMRKRKSEKRKPA